MVPPLPKGAGDRMAHLDILKALEKRRRNQVEIHKSIVSGIQHQAHVRQQMDKQIAKAEHTRIKGMLSHASGWHPQIMRDRYEMLSKIVGEN